MSKTRCSRLVLAFGCHVFTTDSIPPDKMEEWVGKVKKKVGLFAYVDWYTSAGRILVFAAGRIDAICFAMEELKAEHDRLWREALGKVGGYLTPPDLRP